jgi:hypothetical protein
VNAKKLKIKKAHFKQINVELEQTANQLIAKINELEKSAKKFEFVLKIEIQTYICTRNESPA